MTGVKPRAPRVVALSGGIGGAKLVLGLARVLEPGALMAVTNSGDDFEHLGLLICPDTDTVFYTLAGLADPDRGWGRADESWRVLETLGALGGETWFQLGDQDLALHLLRSQSVAQGRTLSAVTAELCRAAGIAQRVIPMTDQRVRTMVETDAGPLTFQTYFVREQCRPAVTDIVYDGADRAVPAPGILEALAGPDLAAIVLCPSNPYLSLDPILAIPGMRRAIADSPAPVIAVSPIVGGEALKGPTAKIMRELGVAPSAHSVARHYADILDGFVFDERDADEIALISALGMVASTAPTVMNTTEDKIALASNVLALADRLQGVEA